MKLTCAALAIALLCTSCSEAASSDSCRLTAPPPEAKQVLSPVGRFSVYPGELPAKYTGCQLTWLEDGTRVLLVRVQDGAVRAVERHEPNAPLSICRFSESGALEVGDSSCLPARVWLR